MKEKLQGIETGCERMKGNVTMKETQIIPIIKCPYLFWLLT